MLKLLARRRRESSAAEEPTLESAIENTQADATCDSAPITYQHEADSFLSFLTQSEEGG